MGILVYINLTINFVKDTILSLANKLQQGNMKDESTLREVIHDISKITGREISEEKEQKIVDTILSNGVPKDFNNYLDKMGFTSHCF